MTDGPFRNTKLSSGWKRYGEDLVSDAVSPKERTMRSCDNILNDVDTKAVISLINDLNVYTQRPQMDLDAVVSVEGIFDGHPRSTLTDSLQRHMIANLRDRMPVDTALSQAVASTVSDLIGSTKNRLDEHCISARDRNDMSREDYRKGIDRNRETFASINQAEIRDALSSGHRRAFKQALQKRTGVCDGPDE